jgi:hypothetical protein
VKLPKATRADLHKGGLVYFDWPGPDKPRRDNTYTLETSREAGVPVRFRVLAITAREDGGHRVAARLEGDVVRLLDRRGGYTSFEPQALHNGPEPEPEAVDVATQRRLTAAAGLRREGEISEALEALEDVRGTLERRLAANPAAHLVRRELWQVKGRIDAARTKLRRAAAA